MNVTENAMTRLKQFALRRQPSRLSFGRLHMLLGALVLAPLIGCAGLQAQAEPRVVDRVEIDRYLGTWFELRSIPNSFQRGCTYTSATYALNADSTLRVENTCVLRNEKGEVLESKRAIGQAWIENEGASKLTVSFARIFGRYVKMFGGDYWILELGPLNQDGLYSWVIVGSPGRDYGWILSRTKTLDVATMAELEARLQQQGYNPADFAWTMQD
ncbi:MAG TPA: lipocalin family protein [Pseudobdellovibrionaceae bacterium]|nr:lipocalin family protein [Pseudobdellovibrionaceae bacterium]